MVQPSQQQPEEFFITEDSSDDVSMECLPSRPLPHPEQSTKGFHLNNTISKNITACQLMHQL
jgi:hypothetical protein